MVVAVAASLLVEAYANAYGEYVWRETVARTSTETTQMLTAALDG